MVPSFITLLSHSGKHISLPSVQFHRCVAFRFLVNCLNLDMTMNSWYERVSIQRTNKFHACASRIVWNIYFTIYFTCSYCSVQFLQCFSFQFFSSEAIFFGSIQASNSQLQSNAMSDHDVTEEVYEDPGLTTYQRTSKHSSSPSTGLGRNNKEWKQQAGVGTVSNGSRSNKRRRSVQRYLHVKDLCYTVINFIFSSKPRVVLLQFLVKQVVESNIQ